MKRFDFVKRIFAFIVAAGLCGGLLWAQAKDEAKPSRVVVQEDTGTLVVEGADSEEGKAIEKAVTKNYEFSYRLGGEYTYAFDLPIYSDIGIYSSWQKDMNAISSKMIDALGSKGHLARITNTFEWRWPNNFSLTAFANLTLNYIPAMIDTSLAWVPGCWNASMACFKACGSVLKWSVDGPWLIVNACSGFILPATAFLVCGLSGVVCLLAIPCSVVCLTSPMIAIGGSVDYHFTDSETIDTKLSFGLDVDGYRGMMHMGFWGLFVQGEASASFDKIKLYAQAGYRIDVMNIVTSISTAQGKEKPGLESRYVPAPYVRAGLSYRIK